MILVVILHLLIHWLSLLLFQRCYLLFVDPQDCNTAFCYYSGEAYCPYKVLPLRLLTTPKVVLKFIYLIQYLYFTFLLTGDSKQFKKMPKYSLHGQQQQNAHYIAEVVESQQAGRQLIPLCLFNNTCCIFLASLRLCINREMARPVVNYCGSDNNPQHLKK